MSTDTGQLLCAIQCDQDMKFRIVGVFPSDRLPKEPPPLNTSWGLIANTDDSRKPGSHWIAFYFNHQNKTGEFWDSLGQKPSYYNRYFEPFLKRHCKTYSINTRVIQSPTSTVCGLYCLYYLLFKCKTKSSLSELSFQFGNNLIANDLFVHQFISQYFRCCTRIAVSCSQRNKCLM